MVDLCVIKDVGIGLCAHNHSAIATIFDGDCRALSGIDAFDLIVWSDNDFFDAVLGWTYHTRCFDDDRLYAARFSDRNLCLWGRGFTDELYLLTAAQICHLMFHYIF